MDRSLVPAAKPGAFVRSPVADAAPPRPARRDVHIYLHGRTADQEPMTRGGLPLARRDQTTEPPDAGFRGPSVDLRGRGSRGPELVREDLRAVRRWLRGSIPRRDQRRTCRGRQ
jgi:hypothetical protein